MTKKASFIVFSFLTVCSFFLGYKFGSESDTSSNIFSDAHPSEQSSPKLSHSNKRSEFSVNVINHHDMKQVSFEVTEKTIGGSDSTYPRLVIMEENSGYFELTGQQEPIRFNFFHNNR